MSGRVKRTGSINIRIIFTLLRAFFSAESKSSIGGQAVIEGVMMKGARYWSVAVRGGDSRIHTRTEELRQLPALLKLPVLRGVVTLFQAFSLGIKAIDFSASRAFEEEGEKPMSPLAITSTIAAAFVAGIILFLLLPLYATKLFGVAFPLVEESSLLFNTVDGILRVVVFLIYVIGIGLWKEMRRIYEYHGAEHKVIHAYEDDAELTADSIINRYSPHHPRCGTSFLLIVMLVSIFVFSFIPQGWTFVMKLLSRVLLIPLIAGLSYEMLKLSAKKAGNRFISMMMSPGLMLQRLTTREPDGPQIEVALTALKEVMESGGEANA